MDPAIFGTLTVPLPHDRNDRVHSHTYCGHRNQMRVTSIRLADLATADICSHCGGYAYYAGRVKPEKARLMEVLTVLLEIKQSTRRMRQRHEKNTADADYVTTQHKNVGRMRRRAERALADPQGLNRRVRAEVVASVETMSSVLVDLDRPRTTLDERAALLRSDAEHLTQRVGADAAAALLGSSPWVLVAVADFPVLPRDVAAHLGSRALASAGLRLAAVMPLWAWNEVALSGAINQELQSTLMVWPLPAASGVRLGNGELAGPDLVAGLAAELGAVEESVGPAVRAWAAETEAGQGTWQQLAWHLAHTTHESTPAVEPHWTEEIRRTSVGHGPDQTSSKQVAAQRREEAKRQKATAALFGQALGSLST